MLVSVVDRSQRRGPADAARLCCPTERVWAGGGEDVGVADESAEPEMTYDAAAGWVLPDLRDLVPERGRVEQLTVRWDSVYFETEQHDLLAHGVTLRCRTGQVDAGWQLTVPTGMAGRRSGSIRPAATRPCRKTLPRWLPMSGAVNRCGTLSRCTPTAPRTG